MKIVKSLVERFNDYHEANPDIYAMFELFSGEVVKTGKRKFSAWAIINRIRWESEIVVNSEEPFKICNDFIALYARKYMADHPEHGQLFNIKEMKRA